jgi:hypothetical protein
VHIYVQHNACNGIVIEHRNSYLGKITSERHSLRLDGKSRADIPWLGQSGKSETSAQGGRPARGHRDKTSPGATRLDAWTNGDHAVQSVRWRARLRAAG